ncbi:MAG: chemotaxis protein CheW [Proteobacteria bacterium]|nr:chemotaxis protein CheW [Pseudomonadota bacterium]
MIFEDDETLQMYVEESLEHLSDIEDDLLIIEDQGKNIDEELVNNVFRAAHSIKGGAGFMGLTTIKELSHNVENILGMIRTREMVPEPHIVSILLKAFDKLRELISNIATSNDQDVKVHIDALVSLTTDSLPENEKQTVTKIMTISPPGSRSTIQTSQFDIDQAVKEGKYIYLIEYDMIKDIQKKNKNPIEVMNSMINSGVILETKIDIESVGTLEEKGPVRLPFIVLFASIIEPDMMTVLVEIEEKYIHSITGEMISDDSGQTNEKISEKKEIITESEQAPAQKKIEIKPQTAGTKKKKQPPKKESVKTIKQEIKTLEIEKEEDQTNDNKTSSASTPQSSLRVNINLLDTLMTLAGELVLSRNQLMQSITAKNDRAIEISSQRIDMITSELQEAIMRTRMQPISNVFNKFTRVVRDLSNQLNKDVNLTMTGKDVELDKTIIEAINDPLTHLVRNAVDHGIERPEERMQKGKNPTGEIVLKAYHEAGQVNIEINDDGKGLDGEMLSASAVKKGLLSEQQILELSEKEKISLIFLPGFSTAKEVTDVSGRGVGMDVVKTNLDKLGGIVDIDSEPGHGTTIRIKLPLTLAIIPSQIISVGNERYAIPQVNLDELLRIPASQVKERIEKVGNAEVVRLRGTLLPLLNLSHVLEIDQSFVHPETGEVVQERRREIADRRSLKTPKFYNEKEMPPEEKELSTSAEDEEKRKHTDRRYRAASAINIAVVSAGPFKYGLVVDKLHDSEEIVVKPIGRHLKDCEGYAGATIMGDGKVALILDVASLARMASLSSLEGTDRVSGEEKKTREKELAQKDRTSLLLFKNSEKEHFAAPLNLVERIERIKAADIETVGGRKVVQYRGGSLPLYELNEVAKVSPLPDKQQYEVIVFKIVGKEIGLMVTPPVDAVEVNLNIDATTLKQTGIMGSLIVANHTTLMVDIFEIIKTLNPEWFKDKGIEKVTERADGQSLGKILFAEDSAFFRGQVEGFLVDDGYEVLTAEDGEEAWSLLESHVDEIMLVLTDLEMPKMDGFQLTKKIKNNSRFSHLTVIALTSLAAEEDVAKGKSVGIDDYQIKLDREKLLERISYYISVRD